MELNNDIILSIEDLHFNYARHNTEVLKGVTCQIKRGERVALLGSNVAGKSTLFSLITGLVQETEVLLLQQLNIEQINNVL